jgi:hypothetical protein
MTTGRGLTAGRLSATRGLFGVRELAQGYAITIEGHFSVRISNASPKAVITFLVPVCVNRA